MSIKHILLSRDELETLSTKPVPLDQLDIPEDEKEALRNEAQKLPKPAQSSKLGGGRPSDGHKLAMRVVCVPRGWGSTFGGVVCTAQYLWLLDDQPVPPGYFIVAYG